MKRKWSASALIVALALLAGPVVLASSPDGTPSTAVSRDGADDSLVCADAVDTADAPRCDDRSVTIGLAVRWGYLDDPAVAFLEGRWRWERDDTTDGASSDPTGGSFLGRWRVADTRLEGALWGQFVIPDDGRGSFRGQWNMTGSDRGGYLSGAWSRGDRAHGAFDGHWNYSNGGAGGALQGMWAATSDEGGGFRGHGIAAPTLAPVDWDGFVQTTDGAVRLVRTVRWESGGDRRMGGDDLVYRQTDRQTVEWRSTTTVSWDGLVYALQIPRTDPAAHVTLHTDQASFVWEASELIGLRHREVVDRAGHAIEIHGFLLERHEVRDVARIGVGARWGFLDRNGTDDASRDATDWSGGARISEGGIARERAVSFERGDALLPRENRQAVRWASHTTSGWDGVLMVVLVPVDRLEHAEFTLHAGAFSMTFTLRELLGHHVFDVDDAGHQVEIRAGRA